MNEKIHKLIIIGSGPAGLTAALYTARADLSPLVIEGSKPGGQLMGTTIVENWPGTKSITGPELMKDMKEHVQKFGTTFLSEHVVKVDFSQRPFTLWTNKDKKLQTESVVIATGASPNRLRCPGEEEYWGKGVTTCAVCDGVFYKDKDVVVVGGGDTAMESAAFLIKFARSITIVQIEDSLTASVAMQKRVVDNEKVTILYSSTISEVKGDGTRVQSVIITHQDTKETEEIPTQGLFLAIGLNPNTEPFKGQIELDKAGYVKVENETKTSVEGVFCAGDVHDYRYKQAITAAGSGCKAALDAENYLASHS